MQDTLGDFEAQVLGLAGRRAEQAEVFAIESVETPVSFEANRLKQLWTRRTRGMALRVIAGGHVGLISTTRMENAEQLVADALAVAAFGASAEYQLPSQIGDTALHLTDPSVEALTVEQMVEMGTQMIERARANHTDLLCEAELDRSAITVQIANSAGASGSYRKSDLGVSFGANLIRGTDMLDVWQSRASCRLDFHPNDLVDTVLERVDLAEQTSNVSTGQLPVIFTPKGIAGTLLNSLASGFNGKTVLEGASPVGDKLGQRVFSDRLTLYDDGLIDYGPGSEPFDDEGTPTRKTALVAEGVISSFIYDLYTAARAGTQTTGNAGRGLASLPSPAAHTLTMEPGSASLQEMMADIREGLLVDQVMGAWAGNVLAGEFSGNVHLGYRIQNGKVAGRVKDTMVAGNVFQVLAEVAGVGRELHWVGGSLRLPYLYLPAVGVASKG
jgi:PmbA protein